MATNIISDRLDYMASMYEANLTGVFGARRQFIMFEGPHGLGKTALVHAWGAARDIRVVERSLAQVDVTAFAMSVPVEIGTDVWRVRTLLVEELKPRFPEEKVVLFFDEANRADKYLFSVVMEMWSEFAINGIPMPHLVGCVGAINAEGDDAYAGLATFDQAQARRACMWVELTDSMLPWAEYLCSLAKTESHRKKIEAFCKLFEDNMPDDIRKQVPPRVREWLIYLADAGLPLEWGLGAVGNDYLKIHNSEGEDVTKEMLNKFAQALEAPAVMAEGFKKPYEAALDFCLASKLNLRIIGGTGIAKTSRTKQELAARGVDAVVLSLSTVVPETLAYSVPVGDTIETVVCERLMPETQTRPLVLLADEFSRADRRTAAAVMPITQGRRLRGQTLKIEMTIALDNPPGHGVLAMDSGRIDVAQATRFPVTIFVDEETMGCRSYLVKVHGAAAEEAWAWRLENVSEDNRPLCPPSLLDNLLWQWRAGLPLADAGYKLGGMRVPLPWSVLTARLQGILRGFSVYVADPKKYVQEMAVSEDGMRAAEMYEAITTADPHALLKHPAATGWLMAFMHSDMRFGIIQKLMSLSTDTATASAGQELLRCIRVLGATDFANLLQSVLDKKTLDTSHPLVVEAQNLLTQRKKMLLAAATADDAVVAVDTLSSSFKDVKAKLLPFANG